MNTKGLVTTVLIIAIVIVLIWWIVRWSSQKSTLICSLRCTSSTNCPSGISGPKTTPFLVSDLTGNPESSNYTISLWYYVTQWTQTENYKLLFERVNNTSGSGRTTSIHGCPRIELDKDLNNLSVTVASYSNNSTARAGPTNSVEHTTCGVANVPLQRWVNVLVSVYGRTIDVYIDGKLSKTCIMPGPAYSTNSGAIWCAPGNVTLSGTNTVTGAESITDTGVTCSDEGGVVLTSPVLTGNTNVYDASNDLPVVSSEYNGYIDSVRYWDTATNPQQAYNIYKDGPAGGSAVSNFFNKYYIKVDFIDDGNSEFSFEI